MTSSASSVSRDLLSNNILFLPFSVDSFGGIGPLAHRFLYGTPSSLPSPPRLLPFPPELFTTSNPHASSVSDLTHGPSGICHMFGRANRYWSKSRSPDLFGSSYHSSCPGRWATQLFGINVSASMATCLCTCITRTLHKSKTTRPPSVKGPSFRRPPPPLLFPGEPPPYLRVPLAED